MRRLWWIVSAIILALCFSAGVVFSRAGAIGEEARAASVAPPVIPPMDEPAPLPSTDLLAAPLLPDGIQSRTLRDGRYVVPLAGGGEATLTIDPALQAHMEELYARNEIPHAALVAIEIRTGRVLALVSHESADEADRMGNVATSAFAPSASIFKMITAGALMGGGSGVTPSTRTCYHGGRSSLEDSELLDNPREDKTCIDLGTAFGRSTNAVFGKLALKHLSAPELRDWSARFGYNETIPFNLPVEPSVADIPDEPFERARTAAGFWNTTLSPLHGALLAATVGNGGVMMRPNLVERITSPQGEAVYTFSPVPYKQVLDVKLARQLADLMVHTTTVGTAERYFSRIDALPDRWTPVGKTGTLSRKKPYLQYSWFVGFAPVEQPEIAVAALVCNPLKWRIKAGLAASEAVSTWRRTRPAPEEQPPPQVEPPALPSEPTTDQPPSADPLPEAPDKPKGKDREARRAERRKERKARKKDRPEASPAAPSPAPPGLPPREL